MRGQHRVPWSPAVGTMACPPTSQMNACKFQVDQEEVDR